MSAAGADGAVPSGGARWVKGGAEPALDAYERKVEGIGRGLAALDRIEGSYAAGDRSATYLAFRRCPPDRRRGALRRVRRRRDGLPLHARRPAALSATARGLSQAGAPSDGWYERTMTVYFEPGRFVGGTGAVHGRPAERDEHEVRAAWRQAEAVEVRIAATSAAGVAVAEPRPLCLRRPRGVRGKPTAGTYPAGACFSHERVETGAGWFLGRLSARIW